MRILGSGVVVTGLWCGLVVLMVWMPSAVPEVEGDFAGVVVFGCLDAPAQVGSGCSEAGWITTSEGTSPVSHGFWLERIVIDLKCVTSSMHLVMYAPNALKLL